MKRSYRTANMYIDVIMDPHSQNASCTHEFLLLCCHFWNSFSKSLRPPHFQVGYVRIHVCTYPTWSHLTLFYVQKCERECVFMLVPSQPFLSQLSWAHTPYSLFHPLADSFLQVVATLLLVAAAQLNPAICPQPGTVGEESAGKSPVKLEKQEIDGNSPEFGWIPLKTETFCVFIVKQHFQSSWCRRILSHKVRTCFSLLKAKIGRLCRWKLYVWSDFNRKLMKSMADFRFTFVCMIRMKFISRRFFGNVFIVYSTRPVISFFSN